MLVIDDAEVPEHLGNLEIVRRVGRREILVAIHDIDGTHSMIRDWPPVMSRCLHEVIHRGLPEDNGNHQEVARLDDLVGTETLPETDRFCVESAGLSALTQMEWALRRAIQAGRVTVPGLRLDETFLRTNSEIIRRMWAGEETFAIEQPNALLSFLELHASRLFKLYERVLSRHSRDRNLRLAQHNPEQWRVPYSMEFLQLLHRRGVKNFFLTGAVVEESSGARPVNGIRQEVLSLGFELGPGRLIEEIIGSSWNRKLPKAEAASALSRRLGVSPHQVLMVGDGRSEIAAGVQLGTVTMSRLPRDAQRAREIHRQLGTNYILPDYRDILHSSLLSSQTP